MSWVTKVIKAVAVAAIAGLLVPAAQAADCPPGAAALVGSNSGDVFSTVEFNPLDPMARFSYWFEADPTINEGTLGNPPFADQFQYLCELAGTCAIRDEAFISGMNIAGNSALGTVGCPLSLTNKRATFIFTDSQGSVVISVNGGDANNWNFDLAAANSPTSSPAFEALGAAAKVLTRATELDPTIVSLSRTNSILVKISWNAPRVWTDAPTNPLTGTYSIYYVVVPKGSGPDAGTPVEVPDSDGSNTNTEATVTLPDPVAGQDTLLIVRCNVEGSGGRSITGGPSVPIRVDPTLASPGKGKKLGHDKAPGQNR